MIEFVNSIEGQVHRQICDAADCNNEATENIQVTAGKYGIIELSVCENCVSKFKETE